MGDFDHESERETENIVEVTCFVFVAGRDFRYVPKELNDDDEEDEAADEATRAIEAPPFIFVVVDLTPITPNFVTSIFGID